MSAGRGGAIIHSCTQEERLKQMDARLEDFEDWQRRQNGSLGRIEETTTKLLERVPPDLDRRLSLAESELNRRVGASALVKWAVALVGFGAGATAAEIILSHWLGG